MTCTGICVERYAWYSSEVETSKTATDGYSNGTFDKKGIGNLSFYEAGGLDTWVGGDNDSSGYYFDYESASSKNVAIF